MPKIRTFQLVILLAILATGAVSCATVRKATYPPGFVYLDTGDVHNAMQKMAISVDRLDRLLQETAISSEKKNEEILSELDTIKRATDGMAANASISSHRVITDNIGRFRSRVDAANQAAKAAPPDYGLTASLVGECLACHVKNIGKSEAF